MKTAGIFEYEETPSGGVMITGLVEDYQLELAIRRSMPKVLSSLGLAPDRSAPPDDNSYELVVPDVIDGKPVLALAPHAFANMSFRSIKLPSPLVDVGLRAFYNNSALESVQFGDALLRIGKQAFTGCTALKEINLPNSLCVIEKKAFQFCRSLVKLQLPSSVFSIGTSAFSNSGLISISIPQHLPKGLRRKTFSGCKQLTEVRFTGAIVNIDEYAFSGCVQLKKIEDLQGVELIGVGTFMECESLEFLDLPDGLEEIGDVAFWGCENLRYARVPRSVETIGVGAFAGIKGLLDVDPENPNYQSVADMLLTKDGKKLISFPGGVLYREIPEGVEEIVDYAFFKFRKRPPLKYPKSLKIIGREAYPN